MEKMEDGNLEQAAGGMQIAKKGWTRVNPNQSAGRCPQFKPEAVRPSYPRCKDCRHCVYAFVEAGAGVRQYLCKKGL